MPTATLTSKGQITIPIAVRRALGLHAGDRVEFVPHRVGLVEIVPATRPVASLKGFFGAPPTTAVSLEDMDRAIADAAGHDDR